MNLKDYQIDLTRIEAFAKTESHYTNSIIHKMLDAVVFTLNNELGSEQEELMLTTLLKNKILVKNNCNNCDCKTNEDCKLKQQTASVGCCDETEGQTQISNQ
jgi:hypothetical protein